MNRESIASALQFLKTELGSGLVAADIYTGADGQSLGGINTNPKASALFSRITSQLSTALKSAEFPGLKDYYMLTLEGDKAVVIALLGDYELGMMIDTSEAKQGFVINLVIPGVLEILNK